MQVHQFSVISSTKTLGLFGSAVFFILVSWQISFKAVAANHEHIAANQCTANAADVGIDNTDLGHALLSNPYADLYCAPREQGIIAPYLQVFKQVPIIQSRAPPVFSNNL